MFYIVLLDIMLWNIKANAYYIKTMKKAEKNELVDQRERGPHIWDFELESMLVCCRSKVSYFSTKLEWFSLAKTQVSKPVCCKCNLLSILCQSLSKIF